MPEPMRLFIHRVKRDNAMIESLEKEVMAFLAEIDRKVAELNKRYGIKAAA